MYGGAKSRVFTISLSPQGRAYTRALKSEKSLSPPIPVGVCVGGGGGGGEEGKIQMTGA